MQIELVLVFENSKKILATIWIDYERRRGELKSTRMITKWSRMDRSRAHTTEGMNLAPYHMHTLGRFSYKVKTFE